MTPDHINALFELAGILASLQNVKALRRDQRVRGVDPTAVLFFTMWGCWNIYYYPFLDQPWSAFAAGGLVVVNAVWLWLAWRFR